MSNSRNSLPPYVNSFVDRHGQRRFYFRRNGKRSALPGDPYSAAFDTAYAECLAIPVVTRAPTAIYQRVADQLALYAKSRSRERKIPFNLTASDIEALLRNSGGKCAVTDLNLDFRRFSLTGPGPYSPSLDRIEPSKGYVTGNVRVTCFAINVALNSWGENVFAGIAQAFIAKRERKKIKIGKPCQTGKPQIVDLS